MSVTVHAARGVSVKYFAIAVPHLPSRAWTTVEALVRLQSIATTLHISEGEHKAISIRASPAPDNPPVRQAP